ncbi:hypothetical protein LWF01_10700 [Saxibacter everestensis]|uniref:Uncharacterized protein n=1 Tax=Saxibacter everestensis TaxID=2909229 RepID=A0ABY8QNS8_9MICO|nr:hypothetical protein LWF01_10700 [Brevibacteriaceae bacterium ZFBP1038]
MRVERSGVNELLVDLPHERIDGAPHVKRDASTLTPRLLNMKRQELEYDGHFLVAPADQLPAEDNLGHGTFPFNAYAGPGYFFLSPEGNPLDIKPELDDITI